MKQKTTGVKVIIVALGCFFYFAQLVYGRFNIKSAYFKNKYFKFSLKYLNSNHPRRLHYHANAKQFVRFFLPRGLKINDKEELRMINHFQTSKEYLSDLDNRHIVFIGDSHVEFFSRVRQFESDIFFENSHAIWIGPSTLMGLNVEELKDTVQDALESINVNINCREIYVVWCLGSIDARIAPYEMKLRGLLQDSSSLERSIFDTLDSLNNIVGSAANRYLSKKFPATKLLNCFIGASNCFLDGATPQTMRELKKIRKEEELPTLGSIEDRQLSVNLINSSIESWCQASNYVFYNPHKDATDIRNRKYYMDSVHFTDVERIHSGLVKIFDKEK